MRTSVLYGCILQKKIQERRKSDRKTEIDSRNREFDRDIDRDIGGKITAKQNARETTSGSSYREVREIEGSKNRDSTKISLELLNENVPSLPPKAALPALSIKACKNIRSVFIIPLRFL